MSIRVGVDIGGTFTDLVVLDERTGSIREAKSLTTPEALSRGVMNCLEQAGVDLRQARFVIHGTTVGINAVLERKGARTGLLTTEGFRDVLEIGRGDFKKMYDLLYRKPAPLVPRRLRLEVPERLTSRGQVETALDEEAVREAARIFRNEGVESVAVVFLFSYVDGVHERRAAECLARELPDVSVSASHRISQEWREYERTSTTVINAYVQPIMERYLGALSDGLAQHGFRGQLLVTQSSGGAFSVDAALAQPVHTLESGPAAGAVGCAAVARRTGASRLISFDMGGTTAKCCIVQNGYAETAEEYQIDGQPVRIPLIDIKEVSAGGGSLAWVDPGGALALGPESAGSSPGPACYGTGGVRPTVTDANLAAGRISPEAFLGGRMALDTRAARLAIETVVARPLGMSVTEAAAGIIRLADIKMALAVRSITTGRGLDPRDYTLVAYGGSGPLHATAIARELAIPRIWVPPAPSTFSAWGMLAADLRHDLVRTVLRPLAATQLDWADLRFAEMAAEMTAILPAAEGSIFRRAVDLRYAGQIHTVRIDLGGASDWTGLRGRFDDAHRQAYGYAAPDVDVELLNLRLAAIVPIEPPELPRSGSGSAAPVAERPVFSAVTGRFELAAVFRREQLGAGSRISGPAAIEEASTTTIVDTGDVLTVNDLGFLVIEVGR